MSPPQIRPAESDGLEDVDLEEAVEAPAEAYDDQLKTTETKRSTSSEDAEYNHHTRRRMSKPFIVGLLLLLVVAIIAVIITSTLSVHYSKNNKNTSTATSTATLRDCSWEKIMPFDPSEKKKFGAILAVDSPNGNTLVVGAQGDTENGKDSGSVYVFENNKATGRWEYDTKLVPSDGQPGDTAAYVDISGKFVAVGAKKQNNLTGALYVFMKIDDGTWVEDAKIVPPDIQEGDMLGNQLAIDGKTIIVGARRQKDGVGAAYVYRRTNGQWSFLQKLTASDQKAEDEFGGRINFSGHTAVITKNGPDAYWSDAGSAYVFKDNGVDGFQEVQKLHPEDGILFDVFGTKVDINEDEDMIVIGATKTDSDGNHQGAAYVFTLGSDEIWSQAAKLVPESDDADYMYGKDVAIRGKFVLVLAESAHEDSDTGIIYVYRYTGKGSEWEEQLKLAPYTSDPLSKDGFGSSLAIQDEDTLIIGSRYESVSGFSKNGVAYIIELCEN